MPFTPNIPGFALYTWESQARQYPELGPTGISYFPGVTAWGTVDCLLMRFLDGTLTGILNHYGFDSPWEKTGNINVWVREDFQRQGIGTQLVTEAQRRWGVNLAQQNFTPEGAEFAEKLEKNGICSSL